MDGLDAGIIRELSGPGGSYQWNVRHPYSRIAHNLGVDDETIRRRVRHAERTGLIHGSELIVNPHLIGLEPARIVLDVADPEQRKRMVLSQIRLIDGVLLMLDMHGGGLQVLLFCEDAAMSRRTELISSIAGCRDPLILRNWQALGFRRCDLTLTRTDLMILKSLRKDPRKSTRQVAAETGVSARTVERRIALLTESYAFFHMFRLNFQKLDGVACSLVISYGDEKKKPGLDQRIGSSLERTIYSATNAKTTSLFNFVCSNVAEAEGIREWVRGLDGVAETRMGIIKEYILESEWLDDELQSMLSNA
ncbi:MAG: winged helix-turn-helix transcriptional regulator [Thaumarchaeota archaeon]|nr:winged helix-turn-helix transcriptional regulator [Nitrososphaerota archaeon]